MYCIHTTNIIITVTQSFKVLSLISLKEYIQLFHLSIKAHLHVIGYIKGVSVWWLWRWRGSVFLQHVYDARLTEQYLRLLNMWMRYFHFWSRSSFWNTIENNIFLIILELKDLNIIYSSCKGHWWDFLYFRLINKK